MKIKKVLFLICWVIVTMLLCACGRTDVTLEIAKDGSMKARIEYGIDKSKVAGEEVLGQVTALIKEPLTAAGIDYQEADRDDFHVIYFEKAFKDASELVKPESWQGIPFVPKFTQTKSANAIYVSTDKGKIKFEGELNSDAFDATQILSEDKNAFGGSVTIIAKKAEANIKSSEKDTYKWAGTAADTVKLELSAPYGGTELTNAKATNEENTQMEESEEVKEKTQSAENDEEVSSDESGKMQDEEASFEKDKSGAVIAVIAIIILALAAGAYVYMKKRKIQENNKSEKEEGELK